MAISLVILSRALALCGEESLAWQRALHKMVEILTALHPQCGACVAYRLRMTHYLDLLNIPVQT